MSDFAIIGGICVGLAAVFIAPLVALAMWADSATCHSAASKMEFAGSWGPMQGCMISVDDKWMPISSYKVVKVRP
jgi:hypothetical protein